MKTTNDQNQVSATNVTTWALDPETSRVEFTARMRLLFVTKVSVTGRFSELAGTLTLDEDEPARSQATLTIGTASLNTKLAARDTHLRNADFFAVEHYPTMTFTSQQVEILDQAAGHYQVTGSLTIRGVAREVCLDAWNVPLRTAGDQRLAFQLTAVVNRRDWGLSWERPMQRIADEITLTLHIQFVLTSPPGA